MAFLFSINFFPFTCNIMFDVRLIHELMRQAFAQIASSTGSRTHKEGGGEERKFDYSISYLQKRCSIMKNSIAKGPMPQFVTGPGLPESESGVTATGFSAQVTTW